LEIVQPGPLTTVQDLGRHGYLAAGFCPSGVLDAPAVRVANALLGNPEGAAVLEMTLSGVTGRFVEAATFALVGADMPLSLNGQAVPAYTAVAARAGDTLACGFARTGCRGYLAFAGGIDVPLVMGSRSTHLKCGMGGLAGRKLQRGDVLPLGTPGAGAAAGRCVPPPAALGSPIRLRVTDGPQKDRFAPEALAAFLGAEYIVSPQSDRMGVRLEGPAVESLRGTDILSDGIPLGAVQIPDSGKPILLLADRQTIGGYAKPFVVIGPDLPRLAQARPGDAVRFEAVTVAEAERRARRAEKALRALVRRLGRG
jgi:biotin-dependent carboxylase-like uncharacterized protein